LDQNVIKIVLFMDLNGGNEVTSILITVGTARKLLVTGGIVGTATNRLQDEMKKRKKEKKRIPFTLNSLHY
jgi:hypothetical protein